MYKNILVTGGAGFIGLNLLEYLCNTYKTYTIVCYDALTYASNKEQLSHLRLKYPNLDFVKGNVADAELVRKTLKDYCITDIIHLAAESHVDRSISDPYVFEETNVKGTLVLLTEAKKFWEEEFGTLEGHRFHHVSTDEVFGSLDLDSKDKFDENTRYSPHSPYSASKAASDHFVNAFHTTYGMDTTITNCSNNYGPYQHEEKFMPTVIKSLIEGKKIPVYGDGRNVRDWLYVLDHVKAICYVFHHGKSGETYCVGMNGERSNLQVIADIVSMYCKYMRIEEGKELNEGELFDNSITFVEDRKGHDRRYAIKSLKLIELGWYPEVSWHEGLWNTIDYYVSGGKHKLWDNL